MRTLILLVLSFMAFSTVTLGSDECSRSFWQRVQNKWVGEDQWKNSFAFKPEETVVAEKFLKKPSLITFEGFTPKADKFLKLLEKRYGNNLPADIIHAFKTLDSFHFLLDEKFYADVSVKVTQQSIIVTIPNVVLKDAGTLGRSAISLDTRFAKLFAVVKKGIEYRMTDHPTINNIIIEPSTVVNTKLKRLLIDFGFKMTSELPSFGEVRGFREGTSPAANFRMVITAKKS